MSLQTRIKSITSSLRVSLGKGLTTQSTCGNKGGWCVVDIIMAAPHCTIAGAACGITGPATAACVVAVLAICLPDITSIRLR